MIELRRAPFWGGLTRDFASAMAAVTTLVAPLQSSHPLTAFAAAHESVGGTFAPWVPVFSRVRKLCYIPRTGVLGRTRKDDP